jgi:hypothetical protein
MKNIISRYTREYQLPAKVTRKHPAAKNAKLTAFNRRGAKDITGLLQIIKKSLRLRASAVDQISQTRSCGSHIPANCD